MNERVIKNHAVTNAVLAAYKERLVIGRYPLVVLKISADPALIDVNIHPAKLEVRFSAENELLNLVTHAISYALHNSELIPEAEEKNPVPLPPAEEKAEEEFLDIGLEEETHFEDDLDELLRMFEVDQEEPRQYPKEELIKEEPQEPPRFERRNTVSLKKRRRESLLPKMYYIGQLYGTYLLFQDKKISI